MHSKNDDFVTKTFCDLVAIPSPSGFERRASEYVLAYLRDLGVKATFDKSGKKNDSDAGNLIAEIKGGRPSTLMFVAHVDTVETGEIPISPVIRNGLIKSDGRTILGVDNKASVASLLEATKEILKMKAADRPSVVLVFSSREESGSMGVKFLDNIKADHVFILDGEGRPGIFINGTLGYLSFEIRLFGRAAHAAVDPDKGLNAVKTAGLVISQLRLGKEEDGSTLNIGRIEGGSKLNIVPEEAVLKGELRAFTEKAMNRRLKELDRVTKSACRSTGCRYKIIPNPNGGLAPYDGTRNDRIMGLCSNAAKAAGLVASFKRLSATTEANIMAAKYKSLLGVCSGGKAPHSKSESISVKELQEFKRLIVEIVKSGY